MTNYETILVTRDDRVGTITLNRPKALNALNSQVMNEVVAAAAEFDNDPGIGAIIITAIKQSRLLSTQVRICHYVVPNCVECFHNMRPWSPFCNLFPSRTAAARPQSIRPAAGVPWRTVRRTVARKRRGRASPCGGA